MSTMTGRFLKKVNEKYLVSYNNLSFLTSIINRNNLKFQKIDFLRNTHFYSLIHRLLTVSSFIVNKLTKDVY